MFFYLAFKHKQYKLQKIIDNAKYLQAAANGKSPES